MSKVHLPYLIYIILFIFGIVGCKSETSSTIGADGQWKDKNGRTINVSNTDITIPPETINDIIQSQEATEFIKTSQNMNVSINPELLDKELSNLDPPKFYRTSTMLDPIMWLFPIMGNIYYATRDENKHTASTRKIFQDDYNTNEWQSKACRGSPEDARYSAFYSIFEYNTTQKETAKLRVHFNASHEKYVKKDGISFPLKDCSLSEIRKAYETKDLFPKLSLSYPEINLTRKK